MKRVLFTFAIITSAIAAIVARHYGHLSAYACLKPLTTVLIILFAGLSIQEHNRAYARYIVAALVFCLIGDVFLLEPVQN